MTEDTVTRLENESFKLNTLYPEFTEKNGNLVINAFSIVGAIPRRDWKPPEYGGHVGEVWLELASSEKRTNISTHAVINKWRKPIGEIPGL